MRIFYRDIEFMSINDAHKAIGRSLQTLRYLLNDRQNCKGMTHFRDGCHIWIPVKVLSGYRYGPQGATSEIGRDVYHYVELENGTWQRRYCHQCTYNKEPCEMAKEADRIAEEMTEWS